MLMLFDTVHIDAIITILIIIAAITIHIAVIFFARFIDVMPLMPLRHYFHYFATLLRHAAITSPPHASFTTLRHYFLRHAIIRYYYFVFFIRLLLAHLLFTLFVTISCRHYATLHATFFYAITPLIRHTPVASAGFTSLHCYAILLILR